MKEKTINAKECNNLLLLHVKLKPNDFSSLLKNLSKDNILNIKNILELKRKYFYIFEEQNLDNITCELLSFAKALINTYDLGRGSIRKNRSMQIETIKNNHETLYNSLITNIKTPAWDFLLMHYSDLRECYENGLSSRKTKIALTKMYKAKIKEINKNGYISHSTINDFFNVHFRTEKGENNVSTEI